jgi:iron complex outermembrane receptor protein
MSHKTSQNAELALRRTIMNERCHIGEPAADVHHLERSRHLTPQTAISLLRLAILMAVAVPAWPQQALEDLTNKSLEDLMNMQVTSVSKREQKMSQVAAAIFVITHEDIGRSGATNIPDLLRMVPGLDVAQIDANTWAISSRGFNLQFANKLLVLIDGRAVYTPLFGGVNWDTQDVPLEDIERIEVIRGPGGAVWGANAVNGVINIITKKAADTHGGLVVAGGGNTDQGFGTLRYGGEVGRKADYRVFAKYQNNGHFPDLNGQNGADGWHLLHGGFRLESSLSAKDSLTTQGDLYAGNEGEEIVHSVFNPPGNINVERLAELSGGNILSRWHHTFSDRSDSTIQFYFDRYTRNGPQVREVRNTFDFDFQHHFAWGSRQDVTWGLGYRHTADQTVGTIDEAFVPPNHAGELFNLFIQDQITLKPDHLFLTVGTKLENSYFTGFDPEPSVRLAWTPTDHHTFWAAISRASRTPTRRDEGLDAVLTALPGPAEVVLLGSRNAKSEHVNAYEVGYRAQPFERLSVDATVFFNTYFNLQSVEPLPDVAQSNPPLLIHRQILANELRGNTGGIELAANWEVTSRWTLSPGYSFLKMHLHGDAEGEDIPSVTDIEGTSPGHQAQLRSHLDLMHNLSWDADLYFVDRLPAPMIPSHTRADMQLTWRVAESLNLNFVGQDLFRDHHAEFNDQLQSVNSSLVKRSAYVKFTWKF